MKPDVAQPVPPWRVVAASATGKRHVQQKQPGQDAARWESSSRGWLFAAVADGAGSAKLGEVGAATAATAALVALRQQFASHEPTLTPALSHPRGEGARLVRRSSPSEGGRAGEGHGGRSMDAMRANRFGAQATPEPAPDLTSAEARLRQVLDAARAAVATEAASRKAALGDLATTLVCAVAGPAWVAAAQVGDGAVVLGDSEGQLRALTRPLAGEYLNETAFLTSEDMLESAQFQTWSGGLRHLALFSDGLQMLALKMPDGTPHARFFEPLFAWLTRVVDPEVARQELLAWLGSPRVTDRTDDDLTLLLARRLD